MSIVDHLFPFRKGKAIQIVSVARHQASETKCRQAQIDIITVSLSFSLFRDTNTDSLKYW